MAALVTLAGYNCRDADRGEVRLVCGLLSSCAVYGAKDTCMNEGAACVPSHGAVPRYLAHAQQLAQAGAYRGCLVALGEAR